MTAVELRADHLLPPGKKPYGDLGWWGMVMFCISEAMLFAYFIASYFYLGVDNKSWPPAGLERPKLQLPLIMTVLLLASSVSLYFAEKQHDQHRKGSYRLGTAIAILLGLGFLVLQAFEYHDKLKHMSPISHSYASIFFTITGFHGLHVAFGLLLLAWALARDIAGRVDPERPIAIQATSLYWHFVDGVWLVILTCLYLSPRWY